MLLDTCCFYPEPHNGPLNPQTLQSQRLRVSGFGLALEEPAISRPERAELHKEPWAPVATQIPGSKGFLRALSGEFKPEPKTQNQALHPNSWAALLGRMVDKNSTLAKARPPSARGLLGPGLRQGRDVLFGFGKAVGWGGGGFSLKTPSGSGQEST